MTKQIQAKISCSTLPHMCLLQWPQGAGVPNNMHYQVTWLKQGSLLSAHCVVVCPRRLRMALSLPSHGPVGSLPH
jgi:hypothetical protein